MTPCFSPSLSVLNLVHCSSAKSAKQNARPASGWRSRGCRRSWSLVSLLIAKIGCPHHVLSCMHFFLLHECTAWSMHGAGMQCTLRHSVLDAGNGLCVISVFCCREGKKAVRLYGKKLTSYF